MYCVVFGIQDNKRKSRLTNFFCVLSILWPTMTGGWCIVWANDLVLCKLFRLD